ncbi:hypothetical protein [Auraticoccus monumenti]|uniref:hypothetical protein n=1 Tax=Auraticoccus monumenti TaxID=675864 RepID=UPI0012F93326|nr:hypothetical protein [Auraticoccus monumenti]
MSTSARPDDRVLPPPTMSTPHRVAVTVLAERLSRWWSANAASVRTPGGRPLTH